METTVNNDIQKEDELGEELVFSNLMDSFSMFDSKYMKKYMFSFGVIAVGLFIGGPITGGIFAGLFATAGFALSIDRLMETWPEMYNWMITHPGWMEIATTLMFATAFGFTITGLCGGLITNILSSVVIDYYTEKKGLVPGVKTLTFGDMLKGCWKGTKDAVITAKQEIKQIVKEERQSNKIESQPSDIVVQPEVIGSVAA